MENEKEHTHAGKKQKNSEHDHFRPAGFNEVGAQLRGPNPGKKH